ncbi:MAG: hypothetical protein ABSB82_10850 [Terriglobia bacterium]
MRIRRIASGTNNSPVAPYRKPQQRQPPRSELPTLVTELEHRQGGPQVTPRRVQRELWAPTPRLYAVNGKFDLMANIGRALAEGLFALSPPI